MVKNNPKYSIIIPVYNAENTIEKLCRNILRQKYADFELILVNDGSTDSSLSVLKKLTKSDSRVHVINQPNQGPSVARNSGISAAIGELIIFCDSDDDIIPNNLERTLNKFKDTQLDMVIFGWETVDSNGNKGYFNITNNQVISGRDNIIYKTIKSIGDDGRMYNLWNKIFKAKIIKENDLEFNKDLRFGEDLLFIFNFLKHSDAIALRKDNPYYIYTVGNEASLVSSSKLNLIYRIINNESLIDFYDLIENKNIQSESYLEYVKLRWMISFTLGVAAAKASLPNKTRMVAEYFKSVKIKKKLSYTKYYNIKKNIIFWIGCIASIFPLVILLMMGLVLSFRAESKSISKTVNFKEV